MKSYVGAPDAPRDRGAESISGVAPTASPGIGRVQLIGGGVAFILLTVGIFWYQFQRIQSGDEAPKRLPLACGRG